MKSFPSIKPTLFLTLAIAVLFSFTGCSDKDYYDPDFQTEYPLEGIEVPASFDWKTTATVDLKVIVNDEFDNEYHYLVEVFAENPLGEETLNPIAIGFANEEQPFSTRITVPKHVESIYIRQTDPKKRSVTRSYPVAEQINSDFRPLVSRADLMRAAMSRADLAEEPKYTDKYPEDAIVVNPKSPGAAGNGSNYVIKEDYKGTLNFSKSGKLFIAPYVTLEVNALTIPSNLEIIVLKGASLVIEDAELTIQGKLFVAPYAKCRVKNLTTTSNKSVIENWGNFEIGHFRPNDCVVHNYHELSCTTVDLQSGTDFKNYCYFYAEDEIVMNKVDIELDNGYMVSKRIYISQSKIYLKNASMFEAGTGNLDMNTADFYASGDRSLIKSPKIIFNQGNSKNSSYNGPLTIEGIQTKDVTIGGNQVEFAEYEKSMVDIEVCTGIVNPVYPGEEPGGEDGGSIIIQTNDDQYTYLFEDQWPLYGDYDMNDVVFKVGHIITYQNKQNEVVKFKCNFTLQAVGAFKKLAGAVMLDKVPADAIKSIEYTSHAPVAFQTTNGVESGQSNAVIPLFDEAHTAMGLPKSWYVNTVNGSFDNTDYMSYTLTVDFTTPVPVRDINIADLNFFLIADVDRLSSPSDNSRTEIHLRGYKPSSKANTSYFGNHNDNSNSVYYTSKDNLVWGIMVPESYRWTKEETDIQDGYPDFKAWITSGGANETEWWKNPIESALFQR